MGEFVKAASTSEIVPGQDRLVNISKKIVLFNIDPAHRNRLPMEDSMSNTNNNQTDLAIPANLLRKGNGKPGEKCAINSL